MIGIRQIELDHFDSINPASPPNALHKWTIQSSVDPPSTLPHTIVTLMPTLNQATCHGVGPDSTLPRAASQSAGESTKLSCCPVILGCQRARLSDFQFQHGHRLSSPSNGVIPNPVPGYTV
jgi:hypothetical protein